MSIFTVAASATDPGLPYQAIGVVLAALIAGITAIVVAILQKQRNPPTPSTPPTPNPPPGAGHVVSELEWITVRDRSIQTAAGLEALRHEYNTHEQISSQSMQRFHARLEAIFRQQQRQP